jgi:hypothetical protein
MLSRRILVVPLMTGAIVFASSCSDDFTQPNPTTDQLNPAKVAVQQGSPDDPVALARSVPGFGGFFLDEQGTPTIYLKDPGLRLGRKGADAVVQLPGSRRGRDAGADGRLRLGGPGPVVCQGIG